LTQNHNGANQFTVTRDLDDVFSVKPHANRETVTAWTQDSELASAIGGALAECIYTLLMRDIDLDALPDLILKVWTTDRNTVLDQRCAVFDKPEILELLERIEPAKANQIIYELVPVVAKALSTPTIVSGFADVMTAIVPGGSAFLEA
jgi:hypothetical protein